MITGLCSCWVMQDYGDVLKCVKVEADPCPRLMEQYKVTICQILMRVSPLSCSTEQRFVCFLESSRECVQEGASGPYDFRHI